MTISTPIAQVFGWFIGLLCSAIGVVNMFWGNDPGYGVFVFLLSLFFYPPVGNLVKRVTGYSIPVFAKVLLAVFIFWTALGVGELFAKIEMMTR